MCVSPRGARVSVLGLLLGLFVAGLGEGREGSPGRVQEVLRSGQKVVLRLVSKGSGPATTCMGESSSWREKEERREMVYGAWW